MSATRARSIVVRGQVQGVGFRYAMIDTARMLGVQGWVRNRRDGSVEAHVQGSVDAVDALLAWSQRGPPAARVRDVEVAEASVDARLAGFTIRPTA